MTYEPHVTEEGILGEFPYRIFLTSLGSLNGYLGVPPSHPWYGQHYDDVRVGDEWVTVHGGLTYSGASYYGHPAELSQLRSRIEATSNSEDTPTDIPGLTLPSLRPFAEFYQRDLDNELEKQGQPKLLEGSNIPPDLDIWWFGFDCAHGSDLVPGMVEIEKEHGWDYSHDGETYKDENYVRGELEGLAAQAAQVWQLEKGLVTDATD